MDFSNSFEMFSENYGFHGMMRGGSSSSSSLVLDDVRGELVRALVRPGQKGMKPEKVLAALRNHSEAERRRRERINGHLSTLRSLIPGTNKMDKAALLAEVINHLKELRKNAEEATEGILVPMDIDEIRVEQQVYGSDGAPYSIKASLCCDYRHELLSDIKQSLEALHLETVKAEMATLGSRMINDFVITGSKEGNIKDPESCQVLASSVHQVLRSVLDRFYASEEFSARNALSNKRRRVSFFNSPSTSTLGDVW